MIMATERSGKMIQGLEAMSLHLKNENKLFDYYNVSMFYLRLLIYLFLAGMVYLFVRLGILTLSLDSILYSTGTLAFLALIGSWVSRILQKNEVLKENILNIIPFAGKIHNLALISSYCFLFNVFHRSGVPISQINGLLVNYIGGAHLAQDIQRLGELSQSNPDPDRLPKYFTVLPDTLAREIILFEHGKTKFNTIQNYSQFVSIEIDDIAAQILSLEKRILMGSLSIGALVIYLSLIY